MERSYTLAKSVLALSVAIILLFIFPENLNVFSLAKDYLSVFNNSGSPSQYHINTSSPPSKFDIDFKLNNSTSMVSFVGYVNVNSLQVHKFKPFVLNGPTADIAVPIHSYEKGERVLSGVSGGTMDFKMFNKSLQELNLTQIEQRVAKSLAVPTAI
jgi:hypothetical protein